MVYFRRERRIGEFHVLPVTLRPVAQQSYIALQHLGRMMTSIRFSHQGSAPVVRFPCRMHLIPRSSTLFREYGLRGTSIPSDRSAKVREEKKSLDPSSQPMRPGGRGLLETLLRGV